MVKRVKSFSDEDYFRILDPFSNAEMGLLSRSTIGYTILVPIGGSIEGFIEKFNATKNYDMGLVVNKYDGIIKKTTGSFILYGWSFLDSIKFPNKHGYSISMMSLNNLEYLEVLATYDNFK